MEIYLKNAFLMFFLIVLIMIMKNDTFMNNIFYNEKFSFNSKSKLSKRKLEEIENEEEIPLLSEFQTHLPKVYLFFHNIFSKDFSGVCSNLSFLSKPNYFGKDIKNSTFRIGISKPHSQNFLYNIENTNFSLYFILKDRGYVDKHIKVNFTINFSKNFYENKLSKNPNKIEFKFDNITYDTSYYDYFKNEPEKDYNNTANITLIFYYREKIFNHTIFYQKSFSNYSRVYFSFENSKAKFHTNAFQYGSGGYSSNTLNYSIILSLLGMFQIYSFSKFIILLENNNTYSNNLSYNCIIFHVVFDSMVCSLNFYLSLNYESLMMEFLAPSIVFFLLFSVFEIRILYMIFRVNNYELYLNNSNGFRNKLLKFYFIFYVGLFFILLMFNVIVMNFFLLIIFLLNFYSFQIYFCVDKNIKPPFPFLNVFLSTLSKIFMIYYFNGYDKNIFGFKPSLLKVKICLFILISQSLIIVLQKIFGPKFFIPKKFRKKTFDYYTNNINDINEECVICLEKLESNENIFENNKRKKDVFYYLVKFGFYKPKIKKKFMVTPCKHTFHTNCLELWLEMKNECPYCRNKIPPLEYD